MKTHRYIFFTFIFLSTVLCAHASLKARPTRSPRKVPKVDYRALEKNALHTHKQQSAKDQNDHEENIDDVFEQFLTSMSDQDRANIEKVMQTCTKNPAALLFEQVLQHKEKIALALVTVYALLAKANDWPPYDKKPKPEKVGLASWLKNNVYWAGDMLAALDNG